MFGRRIRQQVWIGIALTAWLGAGCAGEEPADDDSAMGNTAGTLAAGTGGAIQHGGTGGKPGTAGMLAMGASGASAGMSGSSGMSASAGKGAAGSSGTGGGASGSSGMSGSAAAGGSSGMSGTGGSPDVSDDAGLPDLGAPGDPNGPCEDLGLLCFDAIDMFILNPECFTCNGGAGCQDCVLFQAI